MESNSKSSIWNVYIFGCIILVLKLFIIDIDTPPWEIAQYSAIDEYYYAINAYNHFEFGNLFGSDKPILFGNPTLTNFVTYFSLETFGDNYLGLRFGSFLFGLLSYTLLFTLLKRSKINPLVINGILVFTIFNFTLANASYIVEPTIMRICSALLSVYCIVLWKRKLPSNMFSLIGGSALISTLFLFSYPTNAFVLLAAYILLVLDQSMLSKVIFKKKNLQTIILRSIYFAIGVGIALVLYYLVNKALGVDLLNNSMSRSGKYSNRLALSVKDIAKYVLFGIRANIFVLNPLFLLLSVVTLSRIKLSKIKEWPYLKYVSFVFLITFFIQSLFINDFPERKLIMFYPFISILVAYDINNVLKKGNGFTVKSLIYTLVFLSGTILTYYKYSRIDYLAWGILVVGILTWIISLKYLKLNLKNRLVVLFGFLLLPELVHTLNYHIINRTYTHKNAEMTLQEYDGKHFFGGFSMGFRGYNKINTYVNPYYYYEQEELYISTIQKLRKNNKLDYSIDYKSNESILAKAGFEPFKTLMVTSNNKEWIIYKETIIE